MRHVHPLCRSRAFSLIELMIVLGIVGILIGLLIPAVKSARGHAIKVTCLSNLRQIGVAVQLYKDLYDHRFPQARYMGDPFLSSDTDPPFNLLLSGVLNTAADAKAARVFRCPGDSQVFPLSGMSYMYQSELSGLKIEEFFIYSMAHVPESQIVVSRDMDNGTFNLIANQQIAVDFFHDSRNLLFADAHAGNFVP
jgi:prepilin-type N-terminal cleavage/methylation domain-containing protein